MSHSTQDTRCDCSGHPQCNCIPDAGTATPELLSLVFAALANGNAQRPAIDTALREAFPGYHFALCLDNDIPSSLPPLATGEGFSLYGISTAGHCASLTRHLESATGFAIALADEDDE